MRNFLQEQYVYIQQEFASIPFLEPSHSLRGLTDGETNWATDQASVEVRGPFLPFPQMLTSPFSSEACPLKRHGCGLC